MSAVVKTITPFINQTILCEALDELGVKYTIENQNIVTERVDYYGNQKFVLINGRYQFQHDSSANRESYSWRKLNFKEFKTVTQFLEAVEKQYNSCYQRKMEELERLRLDEERQKIEQERIAFVEKQKKAVLAKAKELGYAVKEEYVKGKVKLVLVKHTY